MNGIAYAIWLVWDKNIFDVFSVKQAVIASPNFLLIQHNKKMLFTYITLPRKHHGIYTGLKLGDTWIDIEAENIIRVMLIILVRLHVACVLLCVRILGTHQVVLEHIKQSIYIN